MKKYLTLLLLIYSFNCISQCSHNVHRPVAVGGEIYKPSGIPGVMPGDTIKIAAGSYIGIELDQIHGSPGCPVTIIDSGVVTVSDYFRFKTDCHYIHVTGTGSNQTYGFVLSTPFATDRGHHIEVDHLDVTNSAGVGFYIKQIPDTLIPQTVYIDASSYVLNKWYIHDNNVHDIGGEGMYIGHTLPCGGDNGNYPNGDPILPLRMDSVEIAYNIITNTEWDGIQLSNARNGCKIHHNTVYNFGTINMGSQQAGIISGGNTNSEIYNNTIIKGTGNGLQMFGYGVINAHNNTIDSTGRDGTGGGQASVFTNDPFVCPEANPNQEIVFTNNAVNHPMTFGAIRMQNDHQGTQPVDPATVDNNTFCIPGATIGWESSYIFLSGSGGTVSGNTLSCSAGTYSPFCSAGNDQILTLPGNATLLGSATPRSNPITGWLWNKTAGGSATITAPTVAQTTVTGLQVGIYKFDLKVTDSKGLTARDTMQLTVKDIPAPPPVIDSNQIFITWEKSISRFKIKWECAYKTVKILGVQYSTDGTNFTNIAINNRQWISEKTGTYYKAGSGRLYARVLVLLTSGKYNYSLTKSAIRT